MNAAADARQLRIALQRYQYTVAKLPCPGAFASIHAIFKELSDHQFDVRGKPWLNAYELAAITNYVAMFGTNKRNDRLLFPLDVPLNAFKKLWRLAEESNSYSENPAYIATFILRIVYQQLPFVIHPGRIPSMFSRMNHLLSTGAMEAYIADKVGASCKDLFSAAEILFEQFSQSSMYKETDLAHVVDNEALRKVLTIFAATKSQRLAFHRNKLEAKSPSEKPYEVNSLLRYPIIRYGEELYCPYPQLIGYAATRGLFFRFSEEDGVDFREPFRQSTESHVKDVLREALPSAEILTEEDERKLGWKGKVNDVTAIMGESTLLIECKLSGLYVDAKRTASPANIISDVQKQIADPKDRRGLFQLYDKCQAIRSRSLPEELMEKYATVKRIYPVLLLFDEIQMANSPEVMGNIIQDELVANRVKDFEYQIWPS